MCDSVLLVVARVDRQRFLVQPDAAGSPQDPKLDEDSVDSSELFDLDDTDVFELVLEEDVVVVDADVEILQVDIEGEKIELYRDTVELVEDDVSLVLVTDGHDQLGFTGVEDAV